MKQLDEINKLQAKIADLEYRLGEADQLLEAIKAGEVDAFAIQNGLESEVYTLKSGDFTYRILIEEFEEGAINVTEEGLIVYSNRYFLSLLQLPYDQVVGKSIFDFVHPDSSEVFQELFKNAILEKSKGEIELFGRENIPVYISMKSLQPELPTVGVVITDFTEKKRHEKLILDYQKDLELNNQKLLRSNEELASFAYVASHDLQEPLRKIQTFASRIAEKEEPNLTETGQDYFGRIQSSARRMQALIEDLLTYSRTNTAEYELEQTNLKTLVEEVKSDLKDELQQAGATIEMKADCIVNLIPFQFRQLLYNLFTNSLKFAAPERPLQITITSRNIPFEELPPSRVLPEGEYCHIQISDNGMGFDQQYSEKIFELFQRLHSKDQFEGTGIGLAIVKKIVENHNGVVTAGGEKDKGAAFDIYLPVF